MTKSLVVAEVIGDYYSILGGLHWCVPVLVEFDGTLVEDLLCCDSQVAVRNVQAGDPLDKEKILARVFEW